MKYWWTRELSSPYCWCSSLMVSCCYHAPCTCSLMLIPQCKICITSNNWLLTSWSSSYLHYFDAQAGHLQLVVSPPPWDGSFWMQTSVLSTHPVGWGVRTTHCGLEFDLSCYENNEHYEVQRPMRSVKITKLISSNTGSPSQHCDYNFIRWHQTRAI